jgi:hypothetical protein
VARSRPMGAFAVDTGRALMVYPPPKTCDRYAPSELLPRTLAEVRLAVLPKGACHPLVSPLNVLQFSGAQHHQANAVSPMSCSFLIFRYSQK